MSEQLVSRIPSAQDALKTQITAALVGLTPPVGVTLGSDDLDLDERVVISGMVDDWLVEPMTMGPPDAGVDGEQFTLRVLAATTGFTDFAAGRARLFAIVQRIRNAIHADDTLGGTVIEASIAGGEISEGKQEDRRAMEAILRINCEAQVTR